MVMAQQPGPATTGVTATRAELDAHFPVYWRMFIDHSS